MRKPERQDRRAVIVAALRKAMLEKGYAEISLTDLAAAARMSASHLLYYFPSKEAVLERLCSNVLDRVFLLVTAHRDEPPEERIHVLVDNVFLSSVIARQELGIMLELVSISLHNATIRKKIQEYGRAMTDYLIDLFEKCPRLPGLSAEDAAQIAGALWMGLFTNSQTDTVGDAHARQLFRRSLLALANIRSVRSGASAPEARSVARSPRSATR